MSGTLSFHSVKPKGATPLAPFTANVALHYRLALAGCHSYSLVLGGTASCVAETPQIIQ